MWFLTLRPIQWLLVVVFRRFTGGWCFVRKNDRRFVTYVSVDVLGDSRQRPTTILTNREEWDLYVVFQNAGDHRGYLACDNFAGRRLVHMAFPLKPGETAAVRIGAERAMWRFISDRHEEGDVTIQKIVDHRSRGQIAELGLDPTYWL